LGCASHTAVPKEAPATAEPNQPGPIEKPELLIVAGDIPVSQREAMLRAAREFYRFWATDDEQLLPLAISPLFIDHTLPKGRPQGPTGPAVAGKAFHTALPDLQVTVAQQLLVADRVVSHLRFNGHFAGKFSDVQGSGQPIDFIATDIVRVQNGLITDNWHIEDNLTFLQQIGVVPR
jgi:predicted ester cyclase